MSFSKEQRERIGNRLVLGSILTLIGSGAVATVAAVETLPPILVISGIATGLLSWAFAMGSAFWMFNTNEPTQTKNTTPPQDLTNAPKDL